MDQEPCQAGTKRDSLTLMCVHPLKLLPPKPITGIPSVLQPATVAPTEIVPAAITVSVWVWVAVVMSGSILVVLLLFVCQRQIRHSHRTVDKEAQHTDTPLPAPATPPVPEGLPAGLTVNGHPPHHPSSPGGYQNGGVVGGYSREEDTCLRVSGCSSSHVCNGNSRTEGGIPLPATELGGAALVTTKTVQCSY